MKTQMEDNRCTLICGDCLAELKKIPDESIDMVCTDLPYGTTNNDWDKPIDLQRLWPELRRCTKKSAAILLFAQMPYAAELVMSNRKEFRYEWIYEKTNPTGFLNAKKMPLKYHEQILVFYRSLPTYHPQFQPADPDQKRGGVKSSNTYRAGITRPDNKEMSKARRYPGDIIRVSNCSWGKDKGLHPTQKPVELLRYLIETYSDPGDRILDCTMGSGSTGLACKASGREFTGIELNSEYFRIAKDRIEMYSEDKKTKVCISEEQICFFG